jgi:glutaredoxin 3
MKEIIIYSKDICPYCNKAKALLQRKKAKFDFQITEIKITNDQQKEEMISKSNGRMTVPQIFINNSHIGGCDDLYLLEEQGKLDKLLK